MNLLFITDARFFKTPDGNIYSGEFSFSDILWKRYFESFDDVIVIARVFEVDSFKNQAHLISKATILPIFPFESVFSYTKHYFSIKRKMETYLSRFSNEAIIIRGAGSLGYLMQKLCIRIQRPYALEVIGDPYDVYAPGVIKHPLRPILRYLFTFYQKKVANNSAAAMYVTKHTLQKRYPVADTAFSTHASDVFISEFKDKIKTFPIQRPYKILSIGALEQMYKSPDIVLQAIKTLNQNDKTYDLSWLGEGMFKQDMINLAENLNISQQVKFLGSVNREQIIAFLDESDVFVLASRTEGLPRAIIEAMSRGVPCVGTNVGGIPELVHKDLLVDVNDSEGLALKISFLLGSEERYLMYSKYSIDTAREYEFVNLENKRKSFYSKIKEITNKYNNKG